MQDIMLIHRKANAKKIISQDTWTTCLRQILIGHTFNLQNIDTEVDDHILLNENAIQFLIEILCGLHSPILGETEVLGQFKKFFDEHNKQQDSFFNAQKKLFQFIFQTVKEIRSEYLKNTGAQSYGSLTRQFCKDFSSITLLGGGQLAQEIIPWLNESYKLQVISRNPEKLKQNLPLVKNLNACAYDNDKPTTPVVVIAGAIPDSDLLPLITNETRLIIDLRAEKNSLLYSIAKADLDLDYLDLQAFFETIQNNKKELEHRVTLIQTLIQKRCEIYFQGSQIRPLGWDDICA